MVAYDSLLNAAVEHISQAHGRTQAAGLGLQGSGDFKLAKSSETPSGGEDFELVTWLVILPPEQRVRHSEAWTMTTENLLKEIEATLANLPTGRPG